jgi:NADPH2:quinone reductase
VLELREQDAPSPGPGQVRVRVGAAGVNFIDVYFRTGLYPRPLPFVAGLEAAGVVDALGAGVTSLAVGDRVAGASLPGAYAELAVGAADKLVRVPDAIADDVAAAAMLQGMTAHYLCRSTFPVKRGDTALVHAAAGGVGLLLVQMLRELGATVIGTCSSAEKEKLARRRDARDPPRGRLRGRGAAATGGRRRRRLDAVGRSTFDEASARCARAACSFSTGRPADRFRRSSCGG